MNLIIFFILFQDGLHATQITINYDYNNHNVILDLQLNNHLLPIEHYLSYQHANGQKVIKNFTKTDVDLCHYQVSNRLNMMRFLQFLRLI